MDERPARPGGPLATRPLHFIWLCDCSGSMAVDGKTQALNNAIREAIPHMRNVASDNPNADVLVRAIKFLAGNFAPRRVRSRLARQPASPVSGVLFPGGGESPTFPQVRLGCPSLWSAISGISALAGRLWWVFSNLRNFCSATPETGSK
jgi:hypothetical protein